jgi:hypothetical protein
MNRYLVASIVFIFAQHSMAASLLPGAKIYHLKSFQYQAGDNLPAITGKIINYTPTTPLFATDPISVPNSFPNTINDLGNYSVSPPLSKSGYEVWTKSIKYADKKGRGCLIQFAWDPIDKTADIGLTSLNADFWENCSIGPASGLPFGTNIIIDNSKLQSKH